MTFAEQIYQQARTLPDVAAEEVLDFIGYLRMKLERRPLEPWDAETFSRRVAGSIPDFPAIDEAASSDDWPEPLHVGQWNPRITVRREDEYGDDGR